MQGGEVFVPKLPSMKITDLADAIAPEAEKNIIGIRPGEKLHEILLTVEESRHSREFDEYFAIEPAQSFWSGGIPASGKPLPEDFRYTSDDNSWWLTKEELKRLLDEI
jgi:UDP-N-acetylglucosamine 4,6-dehydratase